MELNLLDLQTVLRKIGRGVVMYAVDGSGEPLRWDGTSALTLAHLTDTEGDMNVTPNDTVAELTLPEISGDAIYEATYTGEAPTVDIPLFMADPDLLSIISPTGLASAGHVRVRDVFEHTIVIFPEALFRNADGTYGELTYTAGGWQVDGVAMTAGQQTLLAHSLWFWRSHFMRPERSFLGGHGNDAKNIVGVTLRAMMHPALPDGHRLFTTGDPALASIDILGTS